MCEAEWENLPKAKRAVLVLIVFYLCTCSLVELPYVSCFSVFSVCFFLIEYVLPCQYSMDFLSRFVNWTPGEGVQFRGVFDYGLAIALHSFHVFGPRPVLCMQLLSIH